MLDEYGNQITRIVRTNKGSLSNSWFDLRFTDEHEYRLATDKYVTDLVFSTNIDKAHHFARLNNLKIED